VFEIGRLKIEVGVCAKRSLTPPRASRETHSSCPDLIRASIIFGRVFSKGITGSSPVMTISKVGSFRAVVIDAAAEHTALQKVSNGVPFQFRN
jgi:hypothetical protein